MTSTTGRLRDLQEQCGAAPWRRYGMAGVTSAECDIVAEERLAGVGGSVTTGAIDAAHAELIVAAVNALPALLDVADAARQVQLTFGAWGSGESLSPDDVFGAARELRAALDVLDQEHHYG